MALPVVQESEENKLEYMQLFQQYTAQLEAFIEEHIREHEPEFNLNHFAGLLARQPKEYLDGEVFEMLMTLGTWWNQL